MTRSLTLFASMLAATFAAYAAGQQSILASPTERPAPVVLQAPMWIPPSFDMQTTPPEALWMRDPVASSAVSPRATGTGTETEGSWAADTSAEGARPDASH